MLGVGVCVSVGVGVGVVVVVFVGVWVNVGVMLGVGVCVSVGVGVRGTGTNDVQYPLSFNHVLQSVPFVKFWPKTVFVNSTKEFSVKSVDL